MSTTQRHSLVVSTAYPERLPDDSTLLQAVADGDTVAIGSLCDLHGAQCFSLALRLLEEDHKAAEDIVHQVFVRLRRPVGGTGAGSLSVGEWLLDITRSVCLDLMRARDGISEPARMYTKDIYLR